MKPCALHHALIILLFLLIFLLILAIYVFIDVSNDATSISNAFASHLVKVYDCPSGTSGGDNLNTDLFLASLVHSDADVEQIKCRPMYYVCTIVGTCYLEVN